MYYMDLM